MTKMREDTAEEGLTDHRKVSQGCTTAGGGDTIINPSLQMQRKADHLLKSQPGLWNEFKDCQKYTEIPCLKKIQKKKIQNKTKNSYCVFSCVTNS